MNVPRDLWGEAVRSAAYLMNRTPSRVLDFATPLQKLQELVKQPINLGLEPICNSEKGYRCYNPLDKKVYVSRDVSFHETTKYHGGENSLQGEMNEEVNSQDITEFVMEENFEQQGNDQNDHSHNGTPSGREIDPEIESDFDGHEPTSDGPELTNHEIFDKPGPKILERVPKMLSLRPKISRNFVPLTHQGYQLPVRSTRGIPKRQYRPDLNAKAKYPIGNYISYHRLAKSHVSAIKRLSSVVIPRDVQEAMKDKRWKKAIMEEIEALKKIKPGIS
ncbi:hypothetical protein OSB04_014013 [Centaurea solstitialis]|uniref:Retroviral polymerase SH3-like domain-containing protein n=1 Tax=Centaurea solstitialis TaxID=347529 RepID=A0AA38WQY5_9ASTR|nr:hypothetical protein OSB04_014013 [Centaurea solstitialis]